MCVCVCVCACYCDRACVLGWQSVRVCVWVTVLERVRVCVHGALSEQVGTCLVPGIGQVGSTRLLLAIELVEGRAWNHTGARSRPPEDGEEKDEACRSLNVAQIELSLLLHDMFKPVLFNHGKKVELRHSRLVGFRGDHLVQPPGF